MDREQLIDDIENELLNTPFCKSRRERRQEVRRVFKGLPVRGRAEVAAMCSLMDKARILQRDLDAVIHQAAVMGADLVQSLHMDEPEIVRQAMRLLRATRASRGVDPIDESQVEADVRVGDVRIWLRDVEFGSLETFAWNADRNGMVTVTAEARSWGPLRLTA